MRTYVFSNFGKMFQIKKQDLRDYAKIKGKKVAFELEKYKAEGLGTISTVRAYGFGGIFRVSSLVITPVERDAPIFIVNQAFIMGINALVIELLDTQLDKSLLEGSEQLKNMISARDTVVGAKDNPLGVKGYDSYKLESSLSKTCVFKKGPLDGLLHSYIVEYTGLVGKAPAVEDTEAKAELSYMIVEKLIEGGSPFTTIFKKAFDDEKAKMILTRFVFGVGR